MSHSISSLIQDARNHLNFRRRGMDARLARLAAAGVPIDRNGMRAWLDATLDREHEVAGGVFHACTVRTSNGCDADLPTLNGIGCRISRVPIQARLVEAGEVVGDDDAVVADESYWHICWGEVGVGYMAPAFVSLDAAKTKGDAEALIRGRLLRRDDCFRTRLEAVAAVEKMLARRVRAD